MPEKSFTDGDIPIQYHFNMLQDHERIDAFHRAIDRVVKPGDKVVELGGGTGVLSFFAAQKAEKVWCVERNRELAETARNQFLANSNGSRVEVVNCDARDFVPPEPVDVVICEMLHVAMIFEQQVNVIDAFKKNYVREFGHRLPKFIPEGSVLFAQPVQQDFSFSGFNAEIPLFQYPLTRAERTQELANLTLYDSFCYDEMLRLEFRLKEAFKIGQVGRLNAVRLATKNVVSAGRTYDENIDWWNQHLVLPLKQPLIVSTGDTIHMQCRYRAGCSIKALEAGLKLSTQPIGERPEDLPNYVDPSTLRR